MERLRGARSSHLASGCFVFVFALLIVESAFGQAIMYNGHAAVADEILLRLKVNNATTMGRIQAVFPQGKLERLSSSLPLTRVHVPGLNLSVLLAAFARHPDVLYAEPNYMVQP